VVAHKPNFGANDHPVRFAFTPHHEAQLSKVSCPAGTSEDEKNTRTA